MKVYHWNFFLNIKELKEHIFTNACIFIVFYALLLPFLSCSLQQGIKLNEILKKNSIL